MRRSGTLLVLSCIVGMPPADAAEIRPRAVLELFTSQGCSSCPPADKLLGELAEDRSFVALSFPVTYWDYLGWKDTFARPENTERQRAYAQQRRDRAVYTPQMVINGRDHVVGSDLAAIKATIDRQVDNSATLSVPIDIKISGDTTSAHIGGSAMATGPVPIWLVQFDCENSVSIGRGENEGRKVTYAHVVRQMQPIGMWKGQAMDLELPTRDLMKDKNKGMALLLQSDANGRPGPILGAALVELEDAKH